MRTKHIGKIIDGYWKILGRADSRHYIIENIYNGRRLRLEYRTLLNILDGKTSVSKIISLYMKKNKLGLPKF